MGKFVLTDCRIYADSADLTSVSNKVTVQTKVEEVEATVFGTSWKQRVAGLHDTSIKVSGYADVGGTDAKLWTSFAGATIYTLAVSSTAGSPTWSAIGLESDYSLLDGGVGQLAQYDLTISGRDTTGLLRGVLALPRRTLTAPAAGTGQNLGTVTASQNIYLILHVFAAGQATVKLESSPDNTFSSPAAVTTATVTAAGAQLLKTPGPSTNAWWRVNVTAVTGTVDLAAAVAIA